MPYNSHQLDSGKWQDGILAKKDIYFNKAIFLEDIVIPKNPDYLIIKKAVHEAKAMLAEAKIILNSDFEVEYSHHYGVKNFRETGVIIVNVIIIIMK